jgi:hypothetical protein
MNHRCRALGLFVAVAALSSLCFTVSASAQAYDPTARPMYKVGKGGPANPSSAPAAQLPQHTFSYNYNGQTISAVIVGPDPATTNSTTTIGVGIIPLKLVYGASNGNMTFDPNTPYIGSTTATQMVAGSPMFVSSIDWVQGGVDIGKTQYIDAYDRANFWGSIQTNNKYHLVFAKPLIAPSQTINVTSAQGHVIANPWSGIPTGTFDYFAFDSQLQTIMKKFKQINPGVLPIFLTYNVYLTEFGQCCIGGYHNANGSQPGGQTYSYATTISQAAVSVFSEDISALSHELGEWQLDPFVDNLAPSLCASRGNSLMENGDPLENNANFGTYPYTVNGFTFHPQDLVTMPYFGAPTSTSVNGFFTFQGETLSVCQNGG